MISLLEGDDDVHELLAESLEESVGIDIREKETLDDKLEILACQLEGVCIFVG